MGYIYRLLFGDIFLIIYNWVIFLVNFSPFLALIHVEGQCQVQITSNSQVSLLSDKQLQLRNSLIFT